MGQPMDTQTQRHMKTERCRQEKVEMARMAPLDTDDRFMDLDEEGG